ncbi:hypothetical protein HanOQP8_Chr12g0432431 [Helianthus annuus]|nr:hypothetical protein HanLR1_Chr12g0431641 [Helianthus annuus]KAJ0677026.1 hypothetical protein HanOQP8_Chr12g0432431 [Helianthus annuus]
MPRLLAFCARYRSLRFHLRFVPIHLLLHYIDRFYRYRRKHKHARIIVFCNLTLSPLVFLNLHLFTLHFPAFVIFTPCNLDLHLFTLLVFNLHLFTLVVINLRFGFNFFFFDLDLFASFRHVALNVQNEFRFTRNLLNLYLFDFFLFDRYRINRFEVG